MARTRSFFPPANCDKCCKPPLVGDSLWHSGIIWLCPACLADATPGSEVSTKITEKFINYESKRSRSRRKRASGDIEQADVLEQESSWHGHAVDSLVGHGAQKVQDALIACGEAATKPGYIRDTLADPDLVAIEASEMRSRHLLANDIVALGLDVSNSIGATNSMEKLLAYEIALAHKIAFEQASKASYESDPAMQVKRLQVSARMMNVSQQGMLNLQKLRTGGTQNVIVQHVHIADGGQAVIGAVQTGGEQKSQREDDRLNHLDRSQEL